MRELYTTTNYLSPKNHSAELEVGGLCVGYEAIHFSSERQGVLGLFGFRRKSFPVLSSITFSINFNDLFAAVIGPNGSGKTTLLRAIAGVVPSSGTIIWQGARIDMMTMRQRKKIGIIFVPNENGLYPGLTVKEHLKLMENDKYSSKDVIEKIYAQINDEKEHLKNSLSFLSSNRKAGDLSGGEQKILGLLRPLFGRFSLILIDEPTAGLSPRWQQLFKIILDMYKPSYVLMTEQYSRAPVAERVGAGLYELRESSLKTF